MRQLPAPKGPTRYRQSTRLAAYAYMIRENRTLARADALQHVLKSTGEVWIRHHL